MTEFYLLVIVITLLYIAWKIPKDTSRERKGLALALKKESMVAQQLTQLKGKTCEFTMKNITSFDYGATGKAEVVDCDDDWVLVAVSNRKGVVHKVLRISQISELREIR